MKKAPRRARSRLKLPQGWRSTPAEAPFSLARDGEDQTIVFSVSPDLVKPADYTITAEADYKGRTYAEGYRMTGYPGVRPYPFYRPATYHAVGVNVTTAPGLRIGFIPGTGDDVPKALENLGQNVRTLSDIDITQGDLSGYDAIILGRPRLCRAQRPQSRQLAPARLREERRRADRAVQSAGLRKQLRPLSAEYWTTLRK